MRIEKGDRILTIDTMINREWVFFREKITRPEWLYHYTLTFLLECIRRGEIREALIEDPLTGELEGQISLFNVDENGRQMTASEIRRERENNR